MASGAVPAVSVGQMVRSCRILAEVTTDTCRRCSPVYPVSMAILAFGRAVSPDERVTGLAVIEEGRIP